MQGVNHPVNSPYIDLSFFTTLSLAALAEYAVQPSPFIPKSGPVASAYSLYAHACTYTQTGYLRTESPLMLSE